MQSLQVLYSRIAIALWKSSRGLDRHIAMQNTSSSAPSTAVSHFVRHPSSKYEKRAAGVTESQVRDAFCNAFENVVDFILYFFIDNEVMACN